MQRNATPQRPPSPVSIDASAYRGFNGRGEDRGPRGYSWRYNRGRGYGGGDYGNRGYGGITQEPERKAQETENAEAGGTPGGRLEIGRTEGGTTAAMAGAPATAIMTPEVVARAAGSPEDGRMEPWNTKGDHLSVTTREAAHRSDETPQQYE